MAGSVQPRSCLSVGCARSGRVDGNAFLLHTDEEGARSSVEMVVRINCRTRDLSPSNLVANFSAFSSTSALSPRPRAHLSV